MAMGTGFPTATAVEEITTLLAGALGKVPVIAFNARFDLTILDRKARRHGVEPLVDRVGIFMACWWSTRMCLTGTLWGPQGPQEPDDPREAFARRPRPTPPNADALAAVRLAWRRAPKSKLGQMELFELHSQITGPRNGPGPTGVLRPGRA